MEAREQPRNQGNQRRISSPDAMSLIGKPGLNKARAVRAAPISVSNGSFKRSRRIQLRPERTRLARTYWAASSALRPDSHVGRRG